MHQIARRWVAAGAHVTWLTARAAGQAPTRGDRRHPRAPVGRGALALPARGRAHAARRVATSTSSSTARTASPSSPRCSPGADVPIVQVVHHVHQDQFDHALPPAARRGGPLPGGHGDASGVRDRGRSPRSRRRPGRSCGTGCASACPIHLVPNGTVARPEPARAARSRPDDHGRRAAGPAQADRPAAGPPPRRRRGAFPSCGSTSSATGPSGPACRTLVTDLGLQRRRHLPRLPARRGPRRACCSRAWLTTSTSVARGLGLLDRRGGRVGRAVRWRWRARGSSTRSSTAARAGWSAPSRDFGAGARRALAELADERRARAIAARLPGLGRAASPGTAAPSLLAGVVLAARAAGDRPAATARPAATSASSPSSRRRADGAGVLAVRACGPPTRSSIATAASLLLDGCDEFDASPALRRLGITDADVRLADRYDLLAGPGPAAGTC